jgi:DNA-binding GntR family transcriptional regulator
MRARAPKPAAPRRPEQSLAQAAYTKLRREIIRCKLKPGQEVSESLLAKRYEVGKTPIREALGRLCHEGLVEALPRRGYRIAPITLAGVRDLLGLRTIMETEAARTAAGRCNVAQLRRLDELCAVGYDPRDPRSVDRFLAANTELHATVAYASGNAALAAAIVQVLDQMERLLHVALELGGSRIDMSHAHRNLVDALAAGDGATASAAVAQQISGVERMILDAALSSPLLTEQNLAAQML